MREPTKVLAQDLFSGTFALLRRERGKAVGAFSLYFAAEFALGFFDELNEREHLYEIGIFDMSWSTNTGVIFLAYFAVYAAISATITRALLRNESLLSDSFADADMAALVRAGLVYAISSVGITLGIVAFIVPGVILAARWVAVVPFALKPHGSVLRSFGLSATLARPSTGGIAACFIAFNLPVFLITFFDLHLGTTNDASWLAGLIFESLIVSLSSVLGLFLVVAFFVRAADAEAEIAEVFE